MPGPDYARTARHLLDMGLDDDTPCALVSHAGRKEERVQRLSISDLFFPRTVSAPAILIVGEVTRTETRHDFSAMLASMPQAQQQFVAFGD